LLSVGLLWVAYRLVFVALQDVLGLSGGARVLSFLPVPYLVLIVVGGLVLGLVGSWLSLRRLLDQPR
jgi:cell division protein FtsX